jgi:hypothetical protein
VKNFASGLICFAGFIAIILGVTWIFQGNDFFLYRYFAPKYEQTRRDVFEQSKAYRQGMVMELQSMRFQYEQASPEHKEALASIILHRSADFDPEAMPPDLRSFIAGLRNPSTKY